METATVHKDKLNICIHDDYCKCTEEAEIASILLELSILVSDAYYRTEK